MAITLATLAENAQDKITEGFINEIVTDNTLLAKMPFDNCVNASGTSSLVYGYRRVETPMEASFRALNAEPAASEPKTKEYTTNLAILSDSWNMDRVAKDAAPDLYELYLEESKNAIIRKFCDTVVNGDTKSDANGFDGLAKALKGSSTEFTSGVSLDAIDQATALSFAEEMDTLFGALVRTPDLLLVGPAMKVKLNAICRVLGLATTTPDSAGNQVASWNGVEIQELKDGSVTTNDVYAVCLGLSEFHGVTLSGANAITVNLPDWTAPGAVKTGDAEFVCGCALKATKAAGVLHPATAAAKA